MAGRFPVDSSEGKVAYLRGTTNFVHSSCPALDIDRKVAWDAVTALGIKKQALLDDSMNSDINVQIRIYKTNPDGCGLAWKHFGDRGDVLPNLLTRKR